MIQFSQLEVKTLRNWIISMYNKYREVLSFLFFGVLTTAVNWVIFYPLYNVAHMNATLAKFFAWLVAVIFAYFTNKLYVYRSKDWSAKVAIPELIQFVGCRIFSGLLEIGFIFVTVDLLHWNGNLMNVIVAVFVVVINYIGGKLLFRRNK